MLLEDGQHQGGEETSLFLHGIGRARAVVQVGVGEVPQVFVVIELERDVGTVEAAAAMAQTAAGEAA